MVEHEKTKKHQKALKLLNIDVQSKIPFMKNSDEVQKSEARLALYIAKHSSISCVDHLVSVEKANLTDSRIVEQIKLKRSKCSAILTNVWYPELKAQLKKDIGNGYYSLIIDESNDISDIKMLGIVIKYFSIARKRIITTFLKLVEIKECDAESIVNSVKLVINEFELQLQKLKGLGTDNAAVMVGIQNGAFQRLKREVPGLILIPCVCHSLQLAVSHASKESLPNNIEFLIAETYNWFSRSSVRQARYNKLYNFINDNHNPKKIIQSCSTRWLSISSAVNRILEQFYELRTHFNIVMNSEHCYTAEVLANMYNDSSLQAYLLFLNPVLEEVNRVNKIFESRDIDLSSVFDELIFLLKSLTYKICREHPNFNVFSSNINENLLPHPYLGYKFEDYVEDSIKNLKLSIETEKNLRHRCIEFLKSLILQIRKRIPTNVDILQKIKIFSPENVLNVRKESIIPVLKSLCVQQDVIEKIDNQWRKIHLVEWKEININKFWVEVFNRSYASQTNPFLELSEFVLSLLILPVSNAEVERLFSQMNLIKTKMRNRMQIKMLNAILQIRAAMENDSKCCHNFEIPKSVIKEISSNTKYSNSNPVEHDADFDNNLLEIFNDCFDLL